MEMRSFIYLMTIKYKIKVFAREDITRNNIIIKHLER